MRSSTLCGTWVVVSASSPAKNVAWTGGMRATSSLWVRAYQLSSDHLHMSTSQTTLDESCATDSFVDPSVALKQSGMVSLDESG